jgi:DNA-3-methyladenine glycosylase II
METVSPNADSWAPARAALRAADPRMASLVDADPTLEPDAVLDGWPTDPWDALVFNVVGQQLSVAATRAILARLRALHDGRLPTPAELLATDTEALRRVGLSRAKTVYLRDLAERLLADGRLDLERLRNLDDDAARTELMEVKGIGRFTADGVLMLALRRPDIWPAADLALRRTVERVWELNVASIKVSSSTTRSTRSVVSGSSTRFSRMNQGLRILTHLALGDRGHTVLVSSCPGMNGVRALRPRPAFLTQPDSQAQAVIRVFVQLPFSSAAQQCVGEGDIGSCDDVIEGDVLDQV